MVADGTRRNVEDDAVALSKGSKPGRVLSMAIEYGTSSIRGQDAFSIWLPNKPHRAAQVSP